LEILEKFDYTVEHRPGNKHSNADALSRVYAAQTSASAPNGDTANWPSLQQQDAQLGYVCNLVHDQLPLPAAYSHMLPDFGTMPDFTRFYWLARCHEY